jgi:hypothetical protein
MWIIDKILTRLESYAINIKWINYLYSVHQRHTVNGTNRTEKANRAYFSSLAENRPVLAVHAHVQYFQRTMVLAGTIKVPTEHL